MRAFTLHEVGLLKKEAKRLKNEKGIPQSRALDEIAAAQGWSNWSKLVAASRSPERGPTSEFPPRAERVRYFVHGDQDESDPSQFYCEFCERFNAATHFETAHSDDAGRRVRSSLEAWRKLPLALKFKFARPNSASNLFQHLHQSGRSSAAEKGVSARVNDASGLFHSWLLEQRWRPDCVGVFARSVSLDPAFPISSDSPAEIRAHLHAASSEELAALEEAWEDFLEAVR